MMYRVLCCAAGKFPLKAVAVQSTVALRTEAAMTRYQVGCMQFCKLVSNSAVWLAAAALRPQFKLWCQACAGMQAAAACYLQRICLFELCCFCSAVYV
jgi:pyruvate kinase